MMRYYSNVHFQGQGLITERRYQSSLARHTEYFSTVTELMHITRMASEECITNFSWDLQSNRPFRTEMRV